MSSRERRRAVLAPATGATLTGAVMALAEEPQSLWPSGRGIEVATFAMTFPQLLARVRRLAKTAPWRASSFVVPEEGFSALILEDIAGQKAFTLIAQDHFAKGIIAVIADIAADPTLVLRAVSSVVGRNAALTASPPERAGESASHLI